MNLTFNNQKIYLNKVGEKVLLSAQISGGKNLDGTYKPSGYLKVRVVGDALSAISTYINATKQGKLPKYVVANGDGFVAYEEWTGKDGIHKDFVAVIQNLQIVGDSDQAEENQKKPLNF